MPHTTPFMPHIIPTIMTVVIQDQRRAQEIPHARLYYLETIDEMKIRTEKEIHMKPNDFSPDERRIWEHIRDGAKGIAWKDYTSRMGTLIRRS
jgi:hypothetical protein